MLDVFSWVGDRAYEFVVTNTHRIADQIETIYPIKDKLYPPDIEGSDQKLRDICYENAYKKYGDPLPEIVEQRLKRELDAIIGRYSIGWDVKRISRLTRAILQLALFECRYVEDVPVGVAVNEAVTLAKKYDGEDAGTFVNGILRAFLRDQEQAEGRAAEPREESAL